MIRSADLLDRFTGKHIDASMHAVIATYWPVPLTIILKAKASLPGWMISSQGTIAIRIPDHAGLQKL